MTFFKHSLFATCTALLAASAVPASAATVISSSAHGVDVNLRVAGVVRADVGPIGSVSGSAGPAYAQSNTVATVNQSATLLALPLVNVRERLSTGVINTSASSAFPAVATGAASASVNGLGLGLDLRVAGIPTTLLSIGARTIGSSTTIDATTGLSAVGQTVIEGLTLSGTALAGLSIDLAAFANPAANSVLVNALGLKIVFNEQIRTGDGMSSLDLTTNAIRVSFDNFLLSGALLTGDVVIAQSRAGVSGFVPGVVPGAVPEPAAWAMMIAGFGLVGAAMRTRQTKVAFA